MSFDFLQGHDFGRRRGDHKLPDTLLKQIQVTDQDLTELAKARATAIQQILLTDTQIDPARVFLVANNKAKAQDKAVRLELTLE